ncbi:RTA1 domain-containing protein [Aspergillus homomorphus CBS 101889]|uniref:RTA1 like protein n=1 Tax=Aspergillus homomorphus (strain CBS 101889) TaxID=1450537 RepID=A0A395HLH9_ASPHC|nr:RTA1 like protein [Aspergillus homomorphus CBS 101889]RAL08791.1 RTA1 like protein [Aspergillus homomorphus CBS 101889]
MALTAQLCQARTWFFISFFTRGVLEVIGYITRSISANQAPNYAMTPGIVQTLFILVAPSLFAASVYMECGRSIVWTEGEKYAIVRPNWITKVFLIGDIAAFVAQGAASLSSSFESGERLIKTGIIVQVVFFGLFVINAGVSHVRIRRDIASCVAPCATPWELHLRVLYVGSSLILPRSVFRLVEYVGGEGNVLSQHEYYALIFDAMLMLLAMLLLNVCYPSAVQNKDLSPRGILLRDLARGCPGLS